MDDYIPKIVHLPGTKLSAEVVLHRTMQKLSRIKAVAIVIQWDDETFDMDWSSMKNSELCMASMIFHKTAENTIVPTEEVEA